MRIFITGASGFIGRHVVPLLLRDKHELLILKRKSSSQRKSEAKVQTVTGDLKNLSRIKKKIVQFDPQVCLHLAWEGIPDYSYEQSKKNLDSSLSLIQMIVSETACRKIIVSGSSWEYGKSRGVCREDDKALSTSFFTWAKNTLYTAGSLLCTQKDVDFVWLRLFFAFGPGQKKHSLIPTLYEAFKKGKNPDIKAPSNAQDFVYVEDVAEAFRLAVNKPIKSGAYNIGREEPVRVADICNLVEKQLNPPLKGKRVSPHPLSFPRKRESPKASTTTTTVRNWADTSKFRRATTWRPRVSIREGIKRQIEFLEST